MKPSDRKILIFVVITTIFLALLGYAWKGRTKVPFVTVPLANVTAPFDYGSSRVLSGIHTGITIIDEAISKHIEIEQLKEALAQEKIDAVEFNEVVAENIRLRQMLKFSTSHPQYDVLAASILTRDFGYGVSTYVIDKGSEDGIKPFMAVVAPGGVVGFISDVYSHSARIQTMLDPRTAIGIIVQRPESRVASLVKGDISNTSLPQMVDIPKDADVLEGDTLVTSGYGGVYPKGMLVGHVLSIKLDGEGYVKRATVDPAVSFANLEEVFVITKSNETAPVWENNNIKLVPQTKRDQVEGIKGAIKNEGN